MIHGAECNGNRDGCECDKAPSAGRVHAPHTDRARNTMVVVSLSITTRLPSLSCSIVTFSSVIPSFLGD